MDKVDWLGLILDWGLTLLAFVGCGVAFYEGRWGAGLLGAVGGIAMTCISIDTTKVIWRQRNG